MRDFCAVKHIGGGRIIAGCGFQISFQQIGSTPRLSLSWCPLSRTTKPKPPATSFCSRRSQPVECGIGLACEKNLIPIICATRFLGDDDKFLSSPLFPILRKLSKLSTYLIQYSEKLQKYKLRNVEKNPKFSKDLKD